MTRSEIVKILQIAAAYDNRIATDAAVHAWGDTAQRCRWAYPEAAEAVKAHYAESTEYLMPAHITDRIRAQRQDTAMRNPIDPPDRTGQRRLAELITGAFQAIPDDWRDDALSRPCPSCAAQPGTPCTRESPEGRAATRIPHPARMKPDKAAS
ncbi:MAG: zinc finger domain-containing protein [Pseudonocardiaceae bacterium]